MALDNAVLQLTAQPPKLEDPIASYQKLMGVKAAQQQQILTQQQIEGAQLENQQRQIQAHQAQAVNDAYSQSFHVDPTTGQASFDMDKMTSHLAQSGAGGAIPGVVSAFNSAQKAKNELQEQSVKTAQIQADYAASHVQAAQASGYNPTVVLAGLQDTFAATKDPKIQQAIQALQQNPTAETAKAIVDPIVAASPAIQESLNKKKIADAAVTTAQSKADAVKREQEQFDLKKPVLQAEAAQATTAQAANKLAKATSLADYTRQWDALPADQKATIPNPSAFSQFTNAERFKVLKSGTTPEQQVNSTQRDVQIAQTDQLRGIEQQNANTNASRLGLQRETAASGTSIKDLDREAPRFAKPYEKMTADANSQLEKIGDARSMINGPAEAQALGIPKVLTALVSGAGSGVRITQAELNQIAAARGITGDIQGWVNKVSGQGKLTTEQKTQLNGVLDDVANRVKSKQMIVNDGLDAIQGAGSRDRIIEADKNTRKKLTDYENNRSTGASTAALPKGNGGVIDKATAQAFYKAAGGDPAKARHLAQQANWKLQ